MRPLSSRGAVIALALAAACTGSEPRGEARRPVPHPHVTTVDSTHVVDEKWGLPPLEVPAGWSYVTAEHSAHFAALVAATNPAALEDVRDGSRFGPVTGRGLEPRDAFVEIHVTTPPPFEGPLRGPRPSRDLRPGDFERAERFLGRPSRTYEARGRDRTYYAIRYWIGPEADATTAAAAVRLATSVRG